MKVLSAILIIVSLAGSFFYTYQRLYVDEIKSLNRDVVEFEQKIEQSEQARKKQEELIAKYNRINQGDRLRISRLVPEDIDGIQLAMEVSELLNDSDVLVNSVDLPNPSNTSQSQNDSTGLPSGVSIASHEISFNVTSGYSNFIELLEALERSLRVIDVTSIAFQASSGSGGEEGSTTQSGSGIYSFSVKGDIYELAD